MSDYGTFHAPDTVRIERLLPGPLDRVWHYLTDAEARAKWLAGGNMALRPGGRVELVFQNDTLSTEPSAPPPKYAHLAGENRLTGRIIACEPMHLLAFTWSEAPDTSEVRFDLEEQGHDVLLTVTHRRLASQGAILSVSAGWHAHLDSLRDHLQGRAPAAFWPRHTALETEYGARLGLVSCI
jgi:uncharacterized protein YndB with AHSA1/START domain